MERKRIHWRRVLTVGILKSQRLIELIVEPIYHCPGTSGDRQPGLRLQRCIVFQPCDSVSRIFGVDRRVCNELGILTQAIAIVPELERLENAKGSI